MEDLIDKLTSNSMYLTIGVILIIVFLFAMFKRIVKLLIFLVIAAALFLVYVHYKGNSVKDKVERMIKG